MYLKISNISPAKEKELPQICQDFRDSVKLLSVFLEESKLFKFKRT